ncbi:MAG: hypothetical protein STSR0001_14860 [Methanothrix sp.]|nr:MAG: hypothetical protein A4E49_00386 [Methanosaeta sp. PtaU1.Bin112]
MMRYEPFIAQDTLSGRISRIFRGYGAADVLIPCAFQHLQVGCGQFPLQAVAPEMRVDGDGLEVGEFFQILI